MSGRADYLIRHLKLSPHPEGGYYAELFRSEHPVARGGVDRSALTTMHFLLASGQVSRWHVVASDEAWHFLEGDPLELLTFDPTAGRLERVTLGPVSNDGTWNPWVVPAGVWQAARPMGDYTLAGCTVGPGFDYEDFRFVRDIPAHESAFAGTLAPFRELL